MRVVTTTRQEPDNSELLKFKLIFYNTLPHCTVFVRAERIKERFFYDYIGAEDYYLWTKLAFNPGEDGTTATLGFVNKPLSSHRMHSARITNDEH